MGGKLIDKLLQTIGEALELASNHLDFCGYGDSWERECAEAQGLVDKIEIALEQFNAYKKISGGLDGR